MKTDRELIELAAKAAGIEIEVYHEEHEPDYEYRVLDHDEKGRAWMRLWDPLNDNGSAFQLMINLGILCWVDVEIMWCAGEEIALDSDPCALARRAIVKRAAEIGEKM